MKRRFCDLCSEEITKELIYELGIYDELLEKDCFQKDLCEKCMCKVKKLIEGLNGS